MQNLKSFKRVVFICISLLAMFVFSGTSCGVTEKSLKNDGVSNEVLRANEYLRDWYVLGPISVLEDTSQTPNAAQQQKAFSDNLPIENLDVIRTGYTTTINSKSYQWKRIQSDKDLVDFTKIFQPLNYAYAYAYTEIEMPEEKTVLFGLGSDDGVKVWINGKNVHENWIGRAVHPDDDLVQAHLVRGKNRVLIKVQNMEYAWGFTFRPLNPKDLTEKFVLSAGRGNMEEVRILLNSGIDVNSKIGPNLTALHAAKIGGRDDIAQLLIDRGADTSLPMPPPELIADSLMVRTIAADSPGAAVLVSQHGDILYEKTFGFADVGNRVKVIPETKFRIGSVTKQFTAAAILKLQEEGKLSVQDPISKYLPDFPRGDEITIHHLLTHTSGIHSFTEKPGFMETVTMKKTPEEIIAMFKNDDLDFNPGDNWHYSNSGYFLLGYLVEKISGQSYGEFLHSVFFKPLGMKNTGVHNSSKILSNEAYGYSYENGNYYKALNWDMSQAGGAGSLYSTVYDLYLWNEAIFHGKVLSESTLQAAFTPATLNDGRIPKGFGTGYGYGWQITEYRGLKEISHTGGLQGFTSALIRYPEKEITIAVLHNSMPSNNVSTSQIAQNIAEFYFWNEMESQVSPVVDSSVNVADYNDYVGQYEYPMGALMQITHEGNRLYAQLGGQPKFEIFPSTRDEFFWKAVDAQVRFVRDASGNVIALVHTQGGRDFEAPKSEIESIAEVDPTIYNDFVGEYELSANIVLKVTTQNGQLFVQASNQPQFEVFPRSENEYFYKVVKADITFHRDASGKVTELVLNQGGGKYTAKKR